MTSDGEQPPALRREVEKQKRLFGGSRVSLLWWPDPAEYFNCPGDPFELCGVSQFGKEILGSDLLHRPHDFWGRDGRMPGSIIFDPKDDQPDAIRVFRDLARRVGELLESLRPDLCENELKPFIRSTNPAVKARDWTLAWIFRRQFNDGSDEPNFGGELDDAFGRLTECIDNELLTVSRESPSPKTRAYKSTVERTLWLDIPISDSGKVEPPKRPDGPKPPDGFCFDGVDAVGLTPDELKLMTFVWSRRDAPPTWNEVAFDIHPVKRVNNLPVLSKQDLYDQFHRLKKKLIGQGWTACIHFAGRGALTSGKVVLREPYKKKTNLVETKRQSTEAKLPKQVAERERTTKKKRASNE